MQSLNRLFRPSSIVVVGGGFWCANLLEQCRKIGFSGEVWHIHPLKGDYADVSELPVVPDAAFVGVNRSATVEVVRRLSGMGAGGAVCFASGFSEAAGELADGSELQAALLEAAGEMRILGPNCYGFVNALDGVALWPDQHGMVPVERGVGIVMQSSNIAINLTMQRRALPIAYMMTAGNQAQTDLAEIGMALLEDERVTALGLHIEGIADLARFEALARKAVSCGKRIVALKIGRSEQAQITTRTHTASLAGSESGGRALLERLGIAQVDNFAAMLETLKLLHVTGPLVSKRIASLSCSGGEASLVADMVSSSSLELPELNEMQRKGLRHALGPKVTLANPLDYHTYIWGDLARVSDCFASMMAGDLSLGCVIIDFPRDDHCDPQAWLFVIDAVIAARERSGKPMALVALLPENMPETVAVRCLATGVVPLAGLSEAISAIEAAAWLGAKTKLDVPPLRPILIDYVTDQSEAEAKERLSACGVRVPKGFRAQSAKQAARAAEELEFPVVLKGEGIAHKTEAGAVVVGLKDAAAVERAAAAMPASTYLIEEMVEGTLAELLVGVVLDPAHGYVLTLAAGGTLAELLEDRISALLPVDEEWVEAALSMLKIGKVLRGYRGGSTADIAAIVRCVMAVQEFVRQNRGSVFEVEINPLLCLEDGAIAVDALVREGENAE